MEGLAGTQARVLVTAAVRAGRVAHVQGRVIIQAHVPVVVDQAMASVPTGATIMAAGTAPAVRAVVAPVAPVAPVAVVVARAVEVAGIAEV